MQRCEVRAKEITAHIRDIKVRERVSGNIASFLADLEKIRSLSDDSSSHKEAQNPDKSDSVPPTTIDAIESREAQRIEKLKNAQVFVGMMVVEPETGLCTETKVVISSDIDAIGRWGYTKLIQASVDGNTESVASLLATGANPNIRDNSGMKALDKALNAGYDEIVILLMPVTRDDI